MAAVRTATICHIDRMHQPSITSHVISVVAYRRYLALIHWRQKLNVLSINPGITGLAQVQGVDMSIPPKLAQLDAQYLKRQSIILDLKIFLMTARGKGLVDRVSSSV